ncbi:hypothetical protein E2C01_065950 [Portunus trituberculatus]|uniref:Single domain-containing protein n=1 Tax=Portunus trituberculatus TaxID=210409 RepID=A0A5B7HPT4_PORTR|nr:hypothetical protein [Portunus trituberculatus]
MRSLRLALAVVVLAAICSGTPLCKMDLHCELIFCGVPNCGPGYEVKLLPCSCCPGCVAVDSQQQDETDEESLQYFS